MLTYGSICYCLPLTNSAYRSVTLLDLITTILLQAVKAMPIFVQCVQCVCLGMCLWRAHRRRVLITKCAGDSQAAQDAPEGDEATSRPGQDWRRDCMHVTRALQCQCRIAAHGGDARLTWMHLGMCSVHVGMLCLRVAMCCAIYTCAYVSNGLLRGLCAFWHVACTLYMLVCLIQAVCLFVCHTWVWGIQHVSCWIHHVRLWIPNP